MTDIRPRTTFYAAHAEHQEYLAKNPNGYCNHKIKFSIWPDLKVLNEKKKSNVDDFVLLDEKEKASGSSIPTGRTNRSETA